MLFAAFCLICLLVLGIKFAVEYRRTHALIPQEAAVQLGPIQLPGDRYYHPGHTWAKPTGAGEVLVGLDAFARRFVGDVKRIVAPTPGQEVEQGRAAWTIEFDGRKLEQPAPVDGEVVAVNEEVLRHPEELREDPYERGWLLKVKSKRADCCSTNLFSASLAKKWVELAIQELQRTYSPLVGAVSQDGGELVEGVAKMLDDEKWEHFKRQYFPVAQA